MKLSEIVSAGAVVAQIKGGERDAVIIELIDALVISGAADAKLRDELVARVLDREKRGSTGFGKGVAVPHVKHKSVKRMAVAIGLSPRGIDFNALDKQPVYSVFLLLSPEDRPEEHLQAMEVIFSNLSKDAFRRSLRQCATNDEVEKLVKDSDARQLGA